MPQLVLPVSAVLASATIGETAADAALLEAWGYRGLWVGEGRLRRDAVTQLTLAATATHSAYLASGIVPFRTRNVTLLAITWKTLSQLAPHRVRLGLGAWWEPIASRAGLSTSRPLTAMREVVHVLRGLFAGRSVSLDGEYVRLDRVRFDAVEDEAGASYDVPIYLAAVGPRMLSLAAEIADGVLLDFFLPMAYTEVATAALTAEPRQIDRPQLVVCGVDERDPDSVAREIRIALTRYLALQQHVAAHCGIDQELVADIREKLTWPATTAQLTEVASLVPLEFVRSVTAVGTATQVIETLEGYLASGASEVVVTPFSRNRNATFEAIARKLTPRKTV